MSATDTLLESPLHALHLELGARMVPFAGYHLPVQYPAGLVAEHHHTRQAAGLFDVSHMGQLRLVGAGAAALLPLTHRDAASVVSFVSGQCKGLSDQNWSGLAGKGRTLVIYMGVATAADITEKLIADGVSPDMPVAVLERGTRKGARAMRTLLTDLGDMIAREDVKSPAVIIVGDVVVRSDAEDRLRTLAKQVEEANS